MARKLETATSRILDTFEGSRVISSVEIHGVSIVPESIMPDSKVGDKPKQFKQKQVKPIKSIKNQSNQSTKKKDIKYNGS